MKRIKDKIAVVTLPAAAILPTAIVLLTLLLAACKGFAGTDGDNVPNPGGIAADISFDKESILLFTDELQKGVMVKLNLSTEQKASVEEGKSTINWEITDGQRAGLMFPGMSLPVAITISSGSNSVTGNSTGIEATILPTINPGQATLRAVFDGEGVRKGAFCAITVLPPPSISVSPSSQNVILQEGGAQSDAVQYSALVSPDGLWAFNPVITWTSSNPQTASVSGSGANVEVRGQAPGSASIRATITVEGRTESGNGTINVHSYTRPSIPVTGISLSQKTTLYMVQTNTSGDIMATIEPSNASIKDITWSASPADAVHILDGANGAKKIKALKNASSVKITATANDKTNGVKDASFQVNIASLQVSFTSPAGLSVVSGDDIELSAAVSTPAASGTNISWSIVGENSNKASIKSNTQGSPATAIITAVGGVQEDANVTVRATATSDSTKYADYTLKITPRRFEIQYNGNGSDSGSMSAQIVAYGSNATLRANTFTKRGYTFGGWATSSGGAALYTDRQSCNDISPIPAHNGVIALYAKWKTPAPEGLSAVPAESKSIAVSWDAVPGVGSYKVYRSTSADGEYALIGSPASNSFTDTGVSIKTTYYYKVSAINNAAESAQSNYVSTFIPIVNADSTSLKTKFGINSHGKPGVIAAFTAVHDYLALNPKVSGTGKEIKIGDIKLGDWIDLEDGIHIEQYVRSGADPAPGDIVVESATNNGYLDVTHSETVPSGQGTLLEMLVVGINSFSETKYKNKELLLNPDAPPHLVFQFRNIPTWHRMHPTDTSVGGYAASEMREYLVPFEGKPGSGAFLAGLLNAGVPEDIIWAPARITWADVTPNDSDIEVIRDKLWLPASYEIHKRGYPFIDAYLQATQGQLQYYYEPSRIRKYSPLENPYPTDLFVDVNVNWWDYWLSTADYSSSKFIIGYVQASAPLATTASSCISLLAYSPFGCSPAFCIR